MRIERVVVNASPLICLSKSGLSNLFPALFTEIVVPDEVYQEITAKSGINLVSTKFKKTDELELPSIIASWDLGKGESGVLAFALQNRSHWAVIDDREARRCAAALGCRHIGTVGIIVLAKKRGIIPSVRENLVKLRNAGLWLSGAFVDEICRNSGEE
jgi:predicted nucleic acid-binding protein